MKLEEGSIKTDLGKEIIYINKEVQVPPSLFLEVKKSLGLENYPDSSFLIYIFIGIYGIQKLNDLFTFIKNILILPRHVSETYNFITKEDIALVDRLDDLMNQLLGITGADRIAIAKVHNGTYDHTGSHEMKFSMLYEVLSNRGKPTKDKVQNIPLNYIREEILLGSSKEFQRIERTQLDSLCDGYLDKIGIVAKDYKLLSVNKVIYGILDIHYITLPDIDFTEDPKAQKRFNTLLDELELCLQSIILKRTWIQKTFSNIFKIKPVFR